MARSKPPPYCAGYFTDRGGTPGKCDATVECNWCHRKYETDGAVRKHLTPAKGVTKTLCQYARLFQLVFAMTQG